MFQKSSCSVVRPLLRSAAGGGDTRAGIVLCTVSLERLVRKERGNKTRQMKCKSEGYNASTVNVDVMVNGQWLRD